MGTVILPMSEGEIGEARALGIREEIIAKMAQGLELEDWEKSILPIGKEYVRGHTKSKGRVVVRPQLRNVRTFRREKLRQFYYDWEIMRDDSRMIYARKWVEADDDWKLSRFFKKEKDLKNWLDRNWFEK